MPTSIVTGPDGALWFTTDSNEAGRITTGGMITLYPVAVSGNGNGVGGIIAGPDGNLWFPVDNQLGEINTAGHIREFPVKISNNSLTDLAVWAKWYHLGAGSAPENRADHDGEITRRRLCATRLVSSI